MDVILLAAGLGKRANLGQPKQFYKINGKPFLIYSMERLQKSSDVSRIIITCQADYLEEYKRYVQEYDIQNVVYVLGGETRQQSVYNAMKLVETPQVMIHEAARPLISETFINEIVDASKTNAAVVPTIPIKFTVAQGGEFMTDELVRSDLHNVQLPQIFNTERLMTCHEKAIEDNYLATEDGTLFFHYGGEVKFIEGRESNIKITTPLDVELINDLLKFK